MKNIGKPCAGKPHARFDEGGQARACSLLYPDVDGSLAIAQLVGYNLSDIQVQGAWSGPARLHLVPHVNAPVADLPVRRVSGGVHFIANLTLPYGRVLHDYKAAGWRS